MYTHGLLSNRQSYQKGAVMFSNGQLPNLLIRTSKMFTPDLKTLQWSGMLKHIVGQSFFPGTFPFFSMSYPKLLVKDRERDSVVNPKSEKIIVLIHTAYIVLRIFSFFAIVF